jgi:Putative Phosphatase.
MKKTEKPVIAIMYDFDKTLCTKNMQEYSFIKSVGMSNEQFWTKSNSISREMQMDPVLAYMYEMIDAAKKNDMSIHREDFVELGKKLKFIKGVETWFERINKYGEEKGVTIEHYIISSGLKEIIEGSAIAKEFKEIFACEYMYDVNGIACWPKNVVNYTTKTQFLFRINKGVSDISDDKTLNDYVPEDERRVPFRNMIYIADGLTDVPCMKLVKVNGGYSIAVYQGTKRETAESLMRDGRVNFAEQANYSEGSKLELLVKDIITEMQIKDKLSWIHIRQKGQ